MKCRKVVACILLVAMLLTLCACGKENSDGKKSSEEKETVSMLTAQKWKDVNSNSELRFYENGTGICWTDTSMEWELSGKEVTVKWRETDRDVIRILEITDRDGYTVLASEDEEYVYAKEYDYDDVFTIVNPYAKAIITDNEGTEVKMTAAEVYDVYKSNELKFKKLYEGAKITFVGTVEKIENSNTTNYGHLDVITFEEGWILSMYHGIYNITELEVGDLLVVKTTIYGCGFGSLSMGWYNRVEVGRYDDILLAKG